MRLAIIIIGIFISTSLFCQNYTTKKTASSKALKAYTEGIQHNIQGQTDKALKAFTDALKADSKFIDAQIMQAAMLYQLNKLAEAEMAFEKVETLDPNYEPEILFSLGNIESDMNKNIEAATHFELYAKNAKANATKKQKAEKMARDMRFLDNAIKNPVPFNPISLGDKINTPQYSEYLPSITADGETLVYTARVGRQEDFFMAKKINNEWQKGEPMTDLNTDENEGAQCISPDGRALFYTACNRPTVQGGCDIFFSQLKNGKWTSPKSFPAISTQAWESQPCITADGRTIYFSSDRAGGQGGRDIWYVTFEGGKWSEARNVGKPINTPNDEQAPFIHPDGVSMYFTSNGHAGMGGQDLYISRLQADNTWSEPENLGYPINTKSDEATLSVNIDGKTAYYAKNVNTSGTGTANYDLFQFDLPEKVRAKPVTYVKATVTDAETKTLLSASRVEVMDLATQKTTVINSTDEKGEVLVCLPLGKNFAFNVSKQQYTFQSENFDLTNKTVQTTPFLINIALQPIKLAASTPSNTEGVKPKEEKPIILKNVFFETNKADLKPESRAELNKLKLLLSENPSMRIEIRGHTDNVGADADNQILSEKRAKAVLDYLVQNGIASDRMTSKGFGEMQPIDTNDTPEGRQNNRRTEFVILK